MQVGIPVKEPNGIFWSEYLKATNMKGLLQKPSLLRFYRVRSWDRPLFICYLLFKLQHYFLHGSPSFWPKCRWWMLPSRNFFFFFNFPPWMTFSDYSLCASCMAVQQNYLETRSLNWQTAVVLKLLLQAGVCLRISSLVFKILALKRLIPHLF